MKKVSLFFAMLLAVCTFQACNNSESGKTDSVEAANESNEDKMSGGAAAGSDSSANMSSSTSTMEDDSEFMVKAASGGMMEVQLGQLALQKAQSRKVKDFGAMIVKDHGAANTELKALAATKNVTLPTTLGDDHQKHVTELREKAGAEFDKAYMSMMVDDHQEDVNDYENASNKGNDAGVKAFASKTLPVLRKHLDAAKSINDGLK